VTDNGSLYADKAIAITVTNVNERPSITSGSAISVLENISTSDTVYAVTATDPDASTTLTYSIRGGVDASLFNIDSSTGSVTFKASPNYEAPTDSNGDNVYNIIVRATDNGTGLLYAEKAVAITVTNVNETPIFTSLSTIFFPVNFATSSGVYSVTAGTNVTYSINGGADAAAFNIDSSSGSVTFKTDLNYDVPSDSNGDNVYNIIIRASDGPLLAEQAVAITVTTLNETPTTPTSIIASTSNGQISIAFTGPINYGGSEVLRYEYSTSSIFDTYDTFTSTSSPLIISGLTNGQIYTYYLRAVNAAGQGTSSGPINVVLPSVSELKTSGSTAEELRTQNYTCADLAEASYSAYDIESAGYTFSDLIAAGFTSIEPTDSTQMTYALTESQFTNVDVNNNIQISSGLLVSNGPKQLSTTSANVIAITKN
jgi:hypothetical protein